MQNRGAIFTLAVLLAVACVYQLSFTWKTNSIKKEAQKYAQGDLNKEYQYLDSIAGEVVYNIGLRKYTFRECQQRELNLGLDLKGGMSVVLEVSVVDILNALATYSNDSIFVQTIRRAEELQKNSQESFVTLFGKAFEEIVPGGKLAQFFYGNPTLKGQINFNSTNAEVLSVLEKETQGAIDNSFNIIRNRIDRFGVAQPNIQRLETSGRILVELPGVKSPDRVRALLQSTAKLEFWETYDNLDFYQYLLEANKAYKIYKESADKLAADTSISGTTEQSEPTSLATKDAEDTTQQEAMGDLSLLEEMEKDTSIKKADGTTEGTQMINEYPLFALMIPSVTGDNKLVPGSVIARVHVKDMQKVERLLEINSVKAAFPRDVKFLWGAKPPKYDKSQNYYELHAIKVTGRDGRAPLDGDNVSNARAEFGQTRATAEVNMTMDSEGTKIWARMTRENVGKYIAIVLDDRVYSAPRVNEEIKGGSSSITGDFSVAEANDLANVLKSGKLPAPARIVQEAVVGPSLGIEAIKAGVNSFIIAFIIIAIYMMLYYNRVAGLVSDIALAVNMFFLIGVLSSLGAVLTLPGIAGIVLTIGMAVDANVIIYERIREEIAAGKGIKLAIKDGYYNAYSAIIDGNVTTLLTGIILYLMGSGPVKGFATTLIIGILTSLFTSIFITRLIFLKMLDNNKTLMFSTPYTENAFKNITIDFIGLRKYAYILSATILLVAVVSLFVRGMNFGVDFTGGRSYVVRFNEKVRTIDVKNLLASEFGQAPDVIIFGNENQVRITTKYKINEKGDNIDSEIEEKLYTGLKPMLPENVDLATFLDEYKQSSTKVGPTIADDIKQESAWAFFVALIGIFIYILIRFKRWQLSAGGLTALFHDALIVIGSFSLFYGVLPFSLEVDQAFIAAILTVIGYSINDTVIIFDRIREYNFLHPKRSLKENYNDAMNSTLSRTFNTSFTTLMTLAVLFVLGGEVIRGFAFALGVGIIVGTYSSIFVAAPTAYELLKKEDANISKE